MADETYGRVIEAGSDQGRFKLSQSNRVVDELLDLEAERPVAPLGLAADLEAVIADGTRSIMSDQGELWIGKGRVAGMLRCEGQAVAQASQARNGAAPSPALAVGIIAHKGMQAAQSHAGLPVADYVLDGLRTVRRQQPKIDDWWQELGPVAQSEVLSGAANAVSAWRDQWPVVPLAWQPRWEPALRVTVGPLVLSAKPDLVIGTPRDNGLQTMLVVDFKTGQLQADHAAEADFYALLATLKWRVPPWRSTVYSVLTGSWSLPVDVDAERLTAAAETLIRVVRRWVEIVDQHDEPELIPGPHCAWCPLSASCEAAKDWEEHP